MSKLILFKGNHKILNIEDIANKAHAITSKGTFKIKENSHSNTFLSYPSFSPIEKIYELSPLNYREIYNYLDFSYLTDMKWTKVPLTSDELNILRTKYYVIVNEKSICKIIYSDLIKILMYLQSLKNISEFSLYENIDTHKIIKSWVLDTFTGSSLELGFFILLDCLERDSLDSFIIEWKKADLFDIDLKGFVSFLDNSFLERSEKAKVKFFLSKFI